MAAKTAAKKTAAPKAPKDKWTFAIENDLHYGAFPSYEAALKGAKEESSDYYDGGSFGGKQKALKVEFFQLAKVVNFEFTVKEVPVMTHKVTVEIK